MTSPDDELTVGPEEELQNPPPSPSEAGAGILVPRVVLEEHLLHLGWPHTDETERKAALPIVDELLERLVESGLPQYAEGPDALFDPVDAINLHRTLARNGGDMVWFAFLERLRLEVGESQEADGDVDSSWSLAAPALSKPVDVECSLTRTRYRGEGSGAMRISLPLPALHPAQENASMKIESTSHPILERNEEGSSIILTLDAGDADQASVEVRYLLRSSIIEPLSAPEKKGAKNTPTLIELNHEGAAASNQLMFGPVSDYLLSVAKNAAPSVENRAQTIKQLFQFCFRWLSAGEVYVSALEPADPLRDLVTKGWFSPLTGSALLESLARSLDIPSRLVHGLHLVPSYPRWTTWTELYIPETGWVPCDLFSCWELASGDIQSLPWASRMFGRLDRRLRFAALPSPVPESEVDPRPQVIVYHSDRTATFATHYLPEGTPIGQDRIAISMPSPTEETEGLAQRLFGFLRRG